MRRFSRRVRRLLQTTTSDESGAPEAPHVSDVSLGQRGLSSQVLSSIQIAEETMSAAVNPTGSADGWWWADWASPHITVNPNQSLGTAPHH